MDDWTKEQVEVSNYFIFLSEATEADIQMSRLWDQWET